MMVINVRSKYPHTSFVVLLSITPPSTSDHIYFGRLRRMLLNKVSRYCAYQTPMSSIITGEKSTIFIRPTRLSYDMQDIGSSTDSMWQFFNERRTQPTATEITVTMSVGQKYNGDNSIAIIEDDHLDIEDTLSRDILDRIRSLNSPAKEVNAISIIKSREATQDVNELAKRFVHRILSTPESPCYNSMSAEMSNHAINYFEIKRYGRNMSINIFLSILLLTLILIHFNRKPESLGKIPIGR